MGATVLHRGLISGYPAAGTAFVGEEIDRRGLLADIADDFALL
jgi:hypothetical protein